MTTDTMTTTTIADCLRGVELGPAQTVGLMQVIPLCSELEDNRFAAPARARVRTTNYGTLEINNPGGGTLLLPSAAAYIVKQAAQDHALPHAALVGAGARRAFGTALCVQPGQGGLISEDAYPLSILPFPLREAAYGTRGAGRFDRLWGPLGGLCRAGGTRGNDLAAFLDHFERELDLFVAEFERIPHQVGAVVLVGGRILGIERGPSAAWFADVWAALIRECYGSAAVLARRQGVAVAPQTEPLRAARDLDDLAAALSETAAAEAEAARNRIRTLAADPFTRSVEQRQDPFAREAIANAQFVGEIVTEGERVHYLSVVTRAAWPSQEDWRAAKPFAA